MASLLEQVESLDFESREKIVLALKKRPEKSKEEIMIEEIKSLKDQLERTEKKLDKRFESMAMLIIIVITFFIFFLPLGSKSSFRLL